MRSYLRWVPTVLVCVLLFLSIVPSASAYVDPGTGSYFLQFLIAAIVGLSYTVRVYWVKIKDLLSRKNRNSQ